MVPFFLSQLQLLRHPPLWLLPQKTWAAEATKVFRTGKESPPGARALQMRVALSGKIQGLCLSGTHMGGEGIRSFRPQTNNICKRVVRGFICCFVSPGRGACEYDQLRAAFADLLLILSKSCRREAEENKITPTSGQATQMVDHIKGGKQTVRTPVGHPCMG